MKQIIRIYKLLFPYLWNTHRVKLATILTLILIIIDISATTYFPYIWKSIVGADISKTSSTWFLGTAISLFIIWLIKKSTPHLREITFFTVTNQAIKEIRLKTILKSHTISLEDLDKYNAQEIISATTRVSQSIRQFMRVSFISIFPSASKTVSLSIALMLTDILSFGIIFSAYIALFLSAFCLQYYTKAKTKGWHITDNVSVAIGRSLYNTISVRFNLKEEEQDLRKLFDLEALAWENHNNVYHALHLVQDIIFYIGAGIIFCLIIIKYANGSIPLETLVLIYGLITSLHSPLLEINRNMTRFFGGMVDLNKTLKILNIPSEQKPLQVSNSIPQTLQIKNISFAHPNKEPILKNISIEIIPGDKIGILGPSGVGKSTLCQIIAGILPPTSGIATYGEDPIWQIQPNSLGEILCYIPQSHLHHEFESYTHEYGFQLKKHPFSGGEYQLYLLNKALEKKPQIIILDETINAMDKNSADRMIERVLKTVPTVILVSHQTSMLYNMKRVIELNDGHLREIPPI